MAADPQAGSAADRGCRRHEGGRLATVALLVLAVLGVGLGLAAPASAHATVVSADPADGTRLRRAPGLVTITFDEPVGIGGVGYLHVIDGAGATVGDGAAYHPGDVGAKVAERLRPGLGDGDYTISYRVISADSHPVAGTIRFVVGAGALVRGEVVGASATDPVTSDVYDIVRWVEYCGLALLGGSWLVATVWPGGGGETRVRRLLRAGAALLAAATLAELIVQGPWVAGSSLSAIGKFSLLADTSGTYFGMAGWTRLVLVVLLWVALEQVLRRSGRPRRLAAGALAALGAAVVATLATTGHAATTSPVWLSVTLDGLHLTSMAIWLGGLAVLSVGALSRGNPGELARVLPTFSVIAFGCVVTLAITGSYAAWRGVSEWDAVLTTPYGLLVLAKVALFVGLLVVANLSRIHVRDRFWSRDGAVDETGHELLRRSVAVEAAIGVVVLAVSGVLVAEPRGKEALAARYRQPVSATASLGGSASVRVVVAPALHGPLDVTVTVDGLPRATVAASATDQAAEVGPLPLALTRVASDTTPEEFEASSVLPVAGRWDIDLVVSTSRFDATTADVTFTLH